MKHKGLTAQQYQEKVNEMAFFLPKVDSLVVMSQETLDRINDFNFMSLKQGDVMGVSRIVINDSIEFNKVYKVPNELKERNEMKHTCHANNCKRPIKPALFMCLKHWNMVNKELKMELYRHYMKGQEIFKDPTEAYIHAARKCIDSVALVEASQKQIEEENPE